MLCTKCKQDKGLNFPIQKGSHNKNGFHSWCRDCHAVAAKKRQQKGIQFLQSLKNKPCLDCGSQYPPCAMDFDHVRGKKRFNLSEEAANHSLAVLLEETLKCEIICAVCHRIRTEMRKKKL